MSNEPTAEDNTPILPVKRGRFASIEDLVDAVSDDKEFAAEFRRRTATKEQKLHNLAHVLIAKFHAATDYDSRLKLVNEIFAEVEPVVLKAEQERNG
jgi:hypothetical protein